MNKNKKSMFIQVILLVIGIVAIFFLLRKPQEDEPTLEVNPRDLRETAELATVEYTIKKIIKYNSSEEKIWGKEGSIGNILGTRKILFSSKTTVNAGVRLNNVSSSNITVDNKEKSIILTLPKPEVLNFNMPPEECKLEYEHTGILRKSFSTKERINILRQGEEDIRADISNGKIGILDEAQKNASEFFVSFLECIGFKSISINFE